MDGTFGQDTGSWISILFGGHHVEWGSCPTIFHNYIGLSQTGGKYTMGGFRWFPPTHTHTHRPEQKYKTHKRTQGREVDGLKVRLDIALL